MALNRIWENRNKGEKTAAGSFGERAEQQEKGSRRKPVAQTRLGVMKAKMQMDALELKAFVNHSHSLIHHHLKGSQGRAGLSVPTRATHKTPVQPQTPARSRCQALLREKHTGMCPRAKSVSRTSNYCSFGKFKTFAAENWAWRCKQFPLCTPTPSNSC